jgi:hypothetical protein
MSRRRSTYRRPAPRRGRAQQRRGPNLFWGRALLTAVVLMILWAHWKGQA